MSHDHTHAQSFTQGGVVDSNKLNGGYQYLISVNSYSVTPEKFESDNMCYHAYSR